MFGKKQNKPISYAEAEEKILRYCAYRERSSIEADAKLREFGLEESQRKKMIAELQQAGVIDDLRFAKLFASGKSRLKKWGKIKIRMELKSHRLPDHVIKKALDEIPYDEYITNLKALLEKKASGLKFKNQYDKNGKLFRYLSNKGYEYELIKEALGEMRDE